MLRAGREQVCQEGLTYPFCSKYHTSITLSIKNSSEICIVICGEAREYGFTDLDGTRPHWGNHARNMTGKYKICGRCGKQRQEDERFYSYWVPGLIELISPDWF